MALAQLVFDHDRFMDKYFYACSRYNVDIIPIKERQHVAVGIFFLSLGIGLELLYLSCLWAIYQQIKLNRFATCYTYMFFLGILDTIGLLIAAIIGGILSIEGVVYCQMPLFNYSYVSVAIFIWIAANTTTLILAINRCVVIYDDDLADRLFKGRRGAMWLIIPILIAILGIWLAPTVFYNSIDSSAVWNPHRHYLPDEPYFHSTYYLLYNWFIVAAIPGVYFIFAIFVATKFRSNGFTAFRHNKTLIRNFSTFLQVLITSVLVVVTSLGFLYQANFESMPIFVFIGFIMYQGSPPLIYICMNHSIRNAIMSKANKICRSTVTPAAQNG